MSLVKDAYLPGNPGDGRDVLLSRWERMQDSGCPHGKRANEIPTSQHTHRSMPIGLKT